MKKRLFAILFFTVAMAFTASAQRHIKGIKAIDVMGGITGKGYYGEFGYAQYLNNKFYITGRIRYEAGKLNDSLNFGGYSLSGAANYTLWNPGEGFFLNATAGASFFVNSLSKQSFEKVNYTIEKQNSITFGPFIGAEAEIFMGNRVVWLFNFRQNYMIKNDIGNWAFYAGTGFRFNIY